MAELGASMLPPAPQSVQRESPGGGAPTPRKLTKMSSKYRRDSGSGAAMTGQTPLVVLHGNGGLTPSLGSLEGHRSNPATPLFSPDTDAAFAALASAAPNSAVLNAAAAAPAPSSRSGELAVICSARALARRSRVMFF